MAGYIGSGASVVSSGAERKKVFDITTNTTSLTGLNYTVGKVHVYHNGVRLVDGTDYTATNSTSITLTVAAVSGDQVVVVSYASYQVALSGIDDQSNAVAITIDSSENVLIGRTTLSGIDNTQGAYIFNEGAFVAQRSSNPSLYLNRYGTDGDIALFRKNGTTVGSIGVYSSDNLYLQGKSDHSGLAFGQAEIYGFRGGSENDGVTSLGSSAGRFKDLYLSGGVYLGGTGSANKLSDVETGTWSPFWCNNAGQAIFSVSPNVNMARYTKIGKQVTASCYFNMPTTFSTSGNYSASAGLQIGGLPFTANGNGGVNDYYAGSVGWYTSFSSSYNSVSSKTPIIYTRTNSNQIELGHANGVSHASTLQEHANNANSGLLLTISYLTNS